MVHFGGLFAFGILTKHQIKDKLTLWVCLAAPIITYALSTYLEKSRIRLPNRNRSLNY